MPKKALPAPILLRYRRRRALRRFLKDMGAELFDQTAPLSPQDVEERIAARRNGFYERLVGDVLERTDIILQGLDRRIEGVSARQGEEIRRLREEMALLRSAVVELQSALDEARSSGPSGLPAPTRRGE